jgi:hypothetical protein
MGKGRYTHRQHSDLISLLLFCQIKEYRPKIRVYLLELTHYNTFLLMEDSGIGNVGGEYWLETNNRQAMILNMYNYLVTWHNIENLK